MGASGKVASGHGAGARDVVVVPRRSESVSRDTVCSLLMGQLQDVSAYFVFFVGSFFDNHICNFYFSLEQTISLTRTAERIITEGDSDDL
jgi:hypothetical protein